MKVNIDIIKKYFNAQEDIEIAILYGSFAMGNITPLSDLDVAVLLRDTPSKERIIQRQCDLTTDIMGISKLNNVDVTILNIASPLLAHQVIKYGKVLKCIDENRYENLIESIINTYLDTKPLYDYYSNRAIENLQR